MPSSTPTTTSAFPWVYTAFFLYIEPIATAVGAYYAFLEQHEYMELTVPSVTGLGGVSTRENIVLNQLANLYFVFVSHQIRYSSHRLICVCRL